MRAHKTQEIGNFRTGTIVHKGRCFWKRVETTRNKQTLGHEGRREVGDFLTEAEKYGLGTRLYSSLTKTSAQFTVRSRKSWSASVWLGAQMKPPALGFASFNALLRYALEKARVSKEMEIVLTRRNIPRGGLRYGLRTTRLLGGSFWTSVEMR